MPPGVDGPSNGFNHQQQNPTMPPPPLYQAGNEYPMHRDQFPPAPMPQPLLVASSQYHQPLEEEQEGGGGFMISTPTAPSPSSGQNIWYLIIEPLNSSEDSYRLEKIRNKQQRLLLLRHAVRCTHNSDPLASNTSLREYETSPGAYRSLQREAMPCSILLEQSTWSHTL